MIDACTLYFPVAKLDLRSMIPGGRSDGGFFRSATWFEYDAGDGVVRLNLGHPDLAGHLRGFRGYVSTVPGSGEGRAEALERIARTKLCVGVMLPRPVAPDSPTFASLCDLIEQFDGFMFVAGSVMLADGSFLVGPMADVDEEELADAPIEPVDPEECRHQGSTEGADPERVALRERNYRLLAERGFRCARWLPLLRCDEGQEVLRPVEEIVARLFALEALFFWVAGTEESTASSRIQAFVRTNGLAGFLTADEREILEAVRTEAHASHADTIGWRLENMWSLSWILGFDPPPPFFTGPLPQAVIDAMLFQFLPGWDVTVAQFRETVRPRSAREVGELEDVFYCAHNAVRSAQLGESTVPRSFHPVRDGGAIHERRHALTWALSPGTEWEETDLST